MTDQETFNKVKEHLLTQNRKSYDTYVGCMYRNADGLKCAIGCLIPDELYHPGIEKEPVTHLATRNDGLGLFLQQFNLPLLEELQGIHDCTPTDEWPDKLEEVAERFELEYFYSWS